MVSLTHRARRRLASRRTANQISNHGRWPRQIGRSRSRDIPSTYHRNDRILAPRSRRLPNVNQRGTSRLLVRSVDMTLTTGARVDVASRADAKSRLLAELAATPARKGYGIAYDLLGNRAEAEEAVQDALARACESIGDLRDPAAAPAWFLRIVTTQCLRNLPRRRLRRRLFGWWPGKDGE